MTEIKNEPKDFEAALAELEQIVSQLEQGNLPLEEAIEAYKRGTQLSQFCKNKLTSAQETVAKLMTDQGSVPLDKE
ncbi:exodeoxyribonuclease VII small subunit [Eremococcus coleocola]|uniref:Exodeoxyribonuclease 7 small subunit n=1 Tax=Eremococcus coleocola ACS-139-V-Col8 TaxID=908337 RepID=E4KNJ0_9LACT|nr:exodeoxyribonuclease VII small subunit [Eremococcus coleocola]EFR31528.1 exodeoxyribonuclease VII, small subunit [Eremococcus coleocola ACS-139-V-Col8]